MRTVITDRQRPAGTASAAVNWSAWQPAVDIYELPDTVADYDDAADNYNDDNVENDTLNDNRLQTKTKRLINDSETEGRSISR